MSHRGIPSYLVLAAGTFVVAAAQAVFVVRPFDVGPVGSDSTSTVLYFSRIVSGEQLELFLGTAPKPLLSLIYGPLFFTFGDWRPISWAAVATYGLAIAAASLLAGRVSGSHAATFFTGTGLLASAGLLQDVSLAYAVSWALLGWSVAGLAVMADRPRYALAGTALMLAALARQETVFITFLAGGFLVAAWLSTRARGVVPPPREAWLVMIGLLSLPIGALHDWLLTRDPLYSFATPALGSAIRPLQDPGFAAQILVNHVGASLPILLLALVGLAALLARRAWPMVIGLVALGPGVATFLLFLGSRRVYVLDRYAVPVDIAIAIAAGIGLSAIAIPIVASLLRGPAVAPIRGVTLAVIAVVVAVIVVPTVGPLDPSVLGAIRADRQIVQNLQAAAPTIDNALGNVPNVRDMPLLRDPNELTPPAVPALLVPARVYPMAAVQFDLPLTQVARLQASRVSSDGSYPSAGEIVLHDRTVDEPADRFRFLEIGQPTTHGGLHLIPLLADPNRGIWVVQIAKAS